MDEKDMPAHSRIAHILRELCHLDIPGLKVPMAQGIVDRLAVIADELREAEMAPASTEDPILSPENQTQQALMRAASVKDGREAALWAVAAAVFSLRDTVERAMTGTAVADPGQLTPEEIESIKRGPVGYTQVVSSSPLAPWDSISPPRPAVTREQVAMAITDASDHCRGSKLACNLTHLCPCYRQVAAVMKLLEGGE